MIGNNRIRGVYMASPMSDVLLSIIAIVFEIRHWYINSFEEEIKNTIVYNNDIFLDLLT